MLCIGVSDALSLHPAEAKSRETRILHSEKFSLAAVLTLAQDRAGLVVPA
jgi:hypothetical protein